MTATLIISPDQNWASKAQNFFLSKGMSCDVAHTGKEAQLKAYHRPYEYFFLDIEVTNHTAVEVCKYLKKVRSQAHIFVTVARDEVLNELLLTEQGLLKLGVHKVIFRPEAESLIAHIQALGKIKTWQDVKPIEKSNEAENETAINDSEFTRVKIEEFFTDQLAVFDYYLRLKSNRYIKIIHKGESPSVDQIKNYQNNGAEYIYFKTADRATFVSYQNQVAQDAIKKSESTDKIFKSIKSATDKYLEEVLVAGIQPALIEEGRAICDNMYNMAKNDQGLKKLLSDFESFDPETFSHSFLVSFFSTIVCKNIDWVGNKALNTLALGALFHDIGVLQLPDEIREKNEANMTPEELAIYKTHPELGFKAMESIPGINIGVIQIVLQHHECINGSGYPKGITAKHTYPLAKVVSLADSFASFVVQMGDTPKNCLKQFLSQPTNLAKFDPDLIKNLIRAF